MALRRASVTSCSAKVERWIVCKKKRSYLLRRQRREGRIDLLFVTGFQE
jgi:hypothetical protein